MSPAERHLRLLRVLCLARVIWDKYNGHQRGGRKLPYRFKG